MKKLILSAVLVTSFLSFSFKSVEYSPTKTHTTESEVGQAGANIILATNNLAEEDFCLIYTTVNNTGLTLAQKIEILEGDAQTLAWMSTVNDNVAVIANNEELINNEESIDLIIEAGLDGIGDERPDVGPCDGYWSSVRSCWMSYLTCILLGGGPENVLAAFLCTLVQIDCINTARNNYPNCPKYGYAVLNSNYGSSQAGATCD